MDFGRLRAVWKRAFSLAWPVMAEQTFRTAMRTTDVLVTALSSPAAVVAIAGPRSEASFVRPRNLVVVTQLSQVSATQVAEGFASEPAAFPNGEAVNAGFRIGRRLYQQVTGPLSRGYNVAASVLAGQSLGEGEPADARYDGRAVAALGRVWLSLCCAWGPRETSEASLPVDFGRTRASAPPKTNTPALPESPRPPATGTETQSGSETRNPSTTQERMAEGARPPLRSSEESPPTVRAGDWAQAQSGRPLALEQKRDPSVRAMRPVNRPVREGS